VSPVEGRDLGEPEAVVTYPLGASHQVRLASRRMTRPSASQRPSVLRPIPCRCATTATGCPSASSFCMWPIWPTDHARVVSTR
jgi:hypothetical protein